MRKFLVEYRDIITEQELRAEFAGAEDLREIYDSFEDLLAEGLSKNGSLTEIQTEDTPKGQSAVTLYRVWYSEDKEDYCDEWLYPWEYQQRWEDECRVIRLYAGLDY